MGDLYLRENPVISELRTEFLLESIIKHQKHSAWRPAPVLTTPACHLQMGRDVGSWAVPNIGLFHAENRNYFLLITYYIYNIEPECFITSHNIVG